MRYKVNLWGVDLIETYETGDKAEAWAMFHEWKNSLGSALYTVQFCENGHPITAWNLDTGYRHVYD